MAKKLKKKQEEEDGQTEQKLLFSFFFSPQFIFEGRAQHGCDRVIHLEYANSWQCICLLVLDLPLGGRSPTQLRSLSAVCLKTPVILPHSATLRQSHFSTSHPPCVCLEAVWMRWGRLLRGGEVPDAGDKWWWKFDERCSASFYCNSLGNFLWQDTSCQYHYHKWRLRCVGDLPPFFCCLRKNPSLSPLWALLSCLNLHGINRKQRWFLNLAIFKRSTMSVT